MNYMGYLCREVYEDGRLTQRQLAERLGVSLGKCNSLVREAIALGYLHAEDGSQAITPAGLAWLEQYRVKNAVILASGIDIRFVLFSHVAPKSLLEADNERLIERTIRQLQEKGIKDITVVVGYLAEKLEYLEDKYGVDFLYNEDYATKSNLKGIYLARKLLGATYIISTDFWLCENLFHEHEPESWIACHKNEGVSDEWCLTVDGKRRIRSMQYGGYDMLVKRGPVFISQDTAHALGPILENAIAQPGMGVLRWEYTLMRHLEALPFYANINPPGVVQDFASMEDLRRFEAQGIELRMNQTLLGIAKNFGIRPEQITNVEWLEVSAGNRVFRFTLDGWQYVCRMPHNALARFVTYKQEAGVYRALQPLDVTEEITWHDSESGTKLSRYLPVARHVAQGDEAGQRQVIALLRRIHQSGVKVRHSFNIGQTLRQYDALCRREGCVLFQDYDMVWNALEDPLAEIEGAGSEQVLCHINAEMHDIVTAPDGSLRLTNWEFSGMCHPLADIAMTGLFLNRGPSGLDELLEWYLERPATAGEQRLCYCYAAVGGVLWSLYGEHCQYEGDAFGAYAMRMYRLGKRYLRALGCL